jgi:hypothetical protein
MILVMIVSLRHLLGWLVSAFHSRQDLILENLALRQQLLVLHAQRPRRRFTAPHKLFWALLQKAWDGWKRPLILVTPRTVVDWHRAGFRLYWKWLSRIRSRGGRKPVSQEIRALIFQMVAENPTWGVRTENSARCENAEVTIIHGMMVASTMNSVLVALFALFASSFRARAALQAEILALRHQLAVLHKNAPPRLRLPPRRAAFRKWA